ncbi:MAG: hypothetical protein JNL58_23675 [Planctomyces sp.]|nr:hypothetical protein [Planctomyces sp.]
MSSGEQETESEFPEVPEGPLSVVEDCWMVGRRNPNSMLQCNTYIRTFRQFGGQRNVCIDPGSKLDYEVVRSNVEQLVGSLQEVHGMTVNHQDPDVVGNAQDFCEGNPEIEMIASEEVWRLLQHNMLTPGRLRLSPGRTRSISTQQPFQFVPTPFCHFRGAMALYDPEQRILYTGDLFGGLNRLGRVHLLAEEDDWQGIAQFHQIYMPSRDVLRHAVREIMNLQPRVEIIAPQHGHIITGDLVGLFLERMHELLVGYDLLSGEWDRQNLSGYRDVLQRLVDCVAEDRGEMKGAICVMRCETGKKVVYVKRGVLPENVGSHTNKSGRDASHGRTGYRRSIGLCNSNGGSRQLASKTIHRITSRTDGNHRIFEARYGA